MVCLIDFLNKLLYEPSYKLLLNKQLKKLLKYNRT